MLIGFGMAFTIASLLMIAAGQGGLNRYSGETTRFKDSPYIFSFFVGIYLSFGVSALLAGSQILPEWWSYSSLSIVLALPSIITTYLLSRAVLNLSQPACQKSDAAFYYDALYGNEETEDCTELPASGLEVIRRGARRRAARRKREKAL